MKKVISTNGFEMVEGDAVQITLPSGKYAYTGVHSANADTAQTRGLESKTVRYFGMCFCGNINSRAHYGFPIQIDEVSVADFLEKIATGEECQAYWPS